MIKYLVLNKTGIAMDLPDVLTIPLLKDGDTEFFKFHELNNIISSYIKDNFYKLACSGTTDVVDILNSRGGLIARLEKVMETHNND